MQTSIRPFRLARARERRKGLTEECAVVRRKKHEGGCTHVRRDKDRQGPDVKEDAHLGYVVDDAVHDFSLEGLHDDSS